jgi:hypothetical protein
VDGFAAQGQVLLQRAVAKLSQAQVFSESFIQASYRIGGIVLWQRSLKA